LPVNVECLGPLSFSPGFSRVYYFAFILTRL